ncbi:MAG: hypothetical protein RLZZ491_1875 [Pseudomonadota bacterium]|jgi:uncharacterized protein (TIGR02300 family)
MPKEEWGVKRVCPSTGKRFYDLNRKPIISPYTGEVVEIDTAKAGRSLVAGKADKKVVKEAVLDDDDLVLDDDLDLDADEADVELDDDVLDEDDDGDTVALDDLTDVAGPGDDD